MNIEYLSAGVPVRFNVPGRYFRLIETTGPVSLTFFRRGADIAESLLVEAGYSESWLATDEGFEAVEVVSATAQTVKFAVRTESSLSYDRAVGNVNVTNNSGLFGFVTPVVGLASVNISGAGAHNRYLLVQNKSAVGTIWITLDGPAATIARGIRLLPGESYELTGYGAQATVAAIGDIASNPDVVVWRSP